MADVAGRLPGRPGRALAHLALLSLGISPRASLGLLRAARVWAAADGRGFVTPDDIKDLAVPVLAHRVVVGTDGRLGGVDRRGDHPRAAAVHTGAVLRCA